jgi:hypothetical protein
MKLCRKSRCKSGRRILIPANQLSPGSLGVSGPDISIHDRDPSSGRANEAPGGLTAPTLTLPAIEESDDPEIYFTAAAIHELDDDLSVGDAVTWIELLSPTNKPPGPGYGQYREKRYAALNSGIVLVEIDYLHESRAVLIDRVPSYPDGDPDAHAYSIVITDPRPTPREGELAVYGFDVDTTMPVLAIPLSGKDSVKLDFGALYSTTFGVSVLWQSADYEQLPERLETYREDDQRRIRANAGRDRGAPARLESSV